LKGTSLKELCKKYHVVGDEMVQDAILNGTSGPRYYKLIEIFKYHVNADELYDLCNSMKKSIARIDEIVKEAGKN
jgi:hypothetical protein